MWGARLLSGSTSDPPLLSLQRLPDIFVSLYNVKRSNFLLGWIHKLNTESLIPHTHTHTHSLSLSLSQREAGGERRWEGFFCFSYSDEPLTRLVLRPSQQSLLPWPSCRSGRRRGCVHCLHLQIRSLKICCDRCVEPHVFVLMRTRMLWQITASAQVPYWSPYYTC